MQAKSTTISKKINLSFIPEEYHKYADIFSKSKVEILAPHYPYDLQIDLEKDSHPLVGTIYSLSKFEQEALKEFMKTWPMDSSIQFLLLMECRSYL